ncbi:MAG: hypothetical protein IKO07_13490 [Clostridia bacterium]|nr:hypothetical protein [Clostridia bacterium]
MARLYNLKNRLAAAARVLRQDAGALIAAAPLPLSLYAAALLLPPELAMRLGPEWLSRLGDLFGTLALTPLFAALAATALAAAWRKRPCPPGEPVKAVWRGILRALATGVCAWALTLALDLVIGLVGSICGLLNTLTDWIPGVGAAVGLFTGALTWLALLAQEYAGLVLLVYAMAALMVDGLWALPQAKRALAVLWGGRTDSLPALGLLFGAWIAARALMALAGALAGGPAAGVCLALAQTALTALSAAAILAVYLRERDRQDGGWTL